MEHQATLTVVRKRQIIGCGELVAVLCDGNEVGRLTCGDVLTVKVEPRNLELSVVPMRFHFARRFGKYREKEKTTLIIHCEPREHLTIECSFSMSMIPSPMITCYAGATLNLSRVTAS